MSVFFVPKEILPEETRVAITPETVAKLIKIGFQGIVQQDAGALSFFTDHEYAQAGAKIVADAAAGYAQADVVLKLHPPRSLPTGQHEADFLKEGSLLVSFLYPHQDLALVERLVKRKITAFSMELLPRISRAQSMDALSSQANLAGYKAVLIAADASPKMFPMMMTAAGTIKPAKVVVMGAGVAGLQAIATAKRLGAVVEVSDIRPSVKEQVQSVGGKFIEIETSENLEDKGGYAKEVSDDFRKKQQALLHRHVAAADVVITTAQVPGKKAPILVTEEMVKAMRSGSVIVDLAVEQGGNCVLSEVGKTVVKHGVTIVGKRNVPGLLPAEASSLFSKNLLAVLQHLFPKGKYKFDTSDEITVGSVVSHAGSLVHPGVFQALDGKLSHLPFAPLAPAADTKPPVADTKPPVADTKPPAADTKPPAATSSALPASVSASPLSASVPPVSSAPPALPLPLVPSAPPAASASAASNVPPAPRPPAHPPTPASSSLDSAFEPDDFALEGGEKTMIVKKSDLQNATSAPATQSPGASGTKGT